MLPTILQNCLSTKKIHLESFFTHWVKAIYSFLCHAGISRFVYKGLEAFFREDERVGSSKRSSFLSCRVHRHIGLLCLGVHLLEHRVVEVLVGEEGGAEDDGEADGEHHAHEGAVDDRVHAVLLPALGRGLLPPPLGRGVVVLLVGLAEDLLHGVEALPEVGDGVVGDRT